MLKKQFYEAPEAEMLLVKFERNILSGEVDSGIPGYNGDKVVDQSNGWS